MLRRIVKDLLAYLPAKLLPALTAFVTVPIFTRLFPPDQYGKYILAFGLSEFLLAGTCTGFAAGAVRFYAVYRLKSHLPNYFAAMFASVSGVTLGAAGLSAALLIALRSLVPADLYPLLWVAILVFMTNAWFEVLMHILRGQEQSKWYTACELLSRYGSVIISVALVLVWGWGVVGLLWGQFLALLTVIIPLIWLTTRGVIVRPGHLSRFDLQQMWKYAWPLTVGNVAFWGLRLADRYIIGFFRGAYEVGLYSVSYNISSRSIDLLVGLFLLVPGPIIMRVWEEQGRDTAEETLTAISRMFFLLVVPAVVGLAVITAPLVRLLAEDAYFDGHRAVLLVACASAAFGLGQLGSFGMLLSKCTHLIARNQLIATGASLILNLITVPAWGFMGAAASACASFVLLAGLQARASARFLTWRWPLKTLLRVLVASVIMGVATSLVVAIGSYKTSVLQLMTLLLAFVVGVFVYGVMLWVLGEVSPHHLLRLASAGSGTSDASPSPKHQRQEVEMRCRE